MAINIVHNTMVWLEGGGEGRGGDRGASVYTKLITDQCFGPHLTMHLNVLEVVMVVKSQLQQPIVHCLKDLSFQEKTTDLNYLNACQGPDFSPEG